jgi:hypothetical protein
VKTLKECGMKTIGQLLEHYEIGALATAIEKNGIYGTDRFGRKRPFRSDEEEAKLVLAGLAEQFRWECCGDPDVELSPADHSDEAWEVPLHLRWTTYGWPEDELPDVGEVVERPRRQSDHTKREDSFLSMIAALASELKIDVRTTDATRQILELMQASELVEPLSETKIREIVKAARSTIDRRGK